MKKWCLVAWPDPTQMLAFWEMYLAKIFQLPPGVLENV